MGLTRLLDEATGSRPRLALLRALRSTRQGYSGRAACRKAGLAPNTGLRALNELAASRVVHVTYGGGVEHRYTLNRDHYLVTPWLLQLLDAEANALASLTRDLAALLEATGVTALLYGSVARGEDCPGSDVDVLLIGDEEQTRCALAATDEAGHRLDDRYGRRLSPLALLPEGLQGAFADEIRRDAVWVCGPTLAKRLQHAEESA